MTAEKRFRAPGERRTAYLGLGPRQSVFVPVEILGVAGKVARVCSPLFAQRDLGLTRDPSRPDAVFTDLERLSSLPARTREDRRPWTSSGARPSRRVRPTT